MAWAKGQTGNPGGRPKALFDVQALARKQTKANIEMLVQLRDQNDDYPTKLRATVALHEIAWGKPSQSVQADVKHSGEVSLIEMIRGKA